MKDNYLSTEGLISNIKQKDVRLFEILKNLNDDLRSNRQATNVKYTPGSNSPQVLQDAGALTIDQVLELITGLIPIIPPDAGGPTVAEFNALVDAFNNHHLTHTSGQTDAFVATDFLEALVKRVRTTTADLVFGTVVDGEFLKRDGTTIVSAAASGGSSGRYEPVTNGDPLAPEILFNGINGDVLMNFIP